MYGSCYYQPHTIDTLCFCSQNKVTRKQGGDNQLTSFSLVSNHCTPVHFNPSDKTGIKRSGIISEYLHRIGLPCNTPSLRLFGTDSQTDKKAEHGRGCLLCSFLFQNWVAEVRELTTKYHCYSSSLKKLVKPGRKGWFSATRKQAELGMHTQPVPMYTAQSIRRMGYAHTARNILAWHNITQSTQDTQIHSDVRKWQNLVDYNEMRWVCIQKKPSAKCYSDNTTSFIYLPVLQAQTFSFLTIAKKVASFAAWTG